MQMCQELRWSRRNVFSARALGAAAGGLLGALFPDESGPAEDDRTLSHWCFARRAMACEFSVYLPGTAPNPAAAAEGALSEIEEMEGLLSVYRESSALSQLNRNAADEPVRTDPRLHALLVRAAELTRQTQGAFDVATGALIRAWGFLRGPRRVPSETERAEALSRCGMQHVRLEKDGLTVRFDVRGLEINLGSIGKGYAIDRAVARMRDAFRIEAALIQGGSSSLYGLGSPAGDGRGWMIGIQDPYDRRRCVATVWLRDRALGTSSISNQYFEVGGRRYGHILDPRSGMPAEELASASALAGDAATADALATAFFVMGLDKTAAFCQDHPDVGAVLVRKVSPAGDVGGGPRVVTFNLSRSDVEVQHGGDEPKRSSPSGGGAANGREDHA